MEEKELQGKVAIVTGASRGIGKAIALALGKSGASVVVNYKSSSDLAEEVVKQINQDNSQAIAFKADVSLYDQAGQLINKTIEQFGQIDILINNAGITRDSLLMRMKENDWDKVLEVNLKSVYNCSSQAIRYMLKAKSGVIINISSVIGLHGNPGQSNYSASKAGIIGFSKSLAKEVASRGIRVNCIAPGFIETDMTNVLDDNSREKLLEFIPLRRLGNPGDVADMVVFLSSEKASYLTGQVISVDGGMNI